MSARLRPATRPTMYFIGVTTSQSSIHGVFPRWAERLQLGDCELRGLDFPLHDTPENYRAAVEFIRRDPLTLGALVTSHKMDVFAACRDQFEMIEPLSRSLCEISSIYKRDGQLHGRAVDPWTSGYALRAFLSRGHWTGDGEALILGAGGAGCALAWQLSNPAHGADRPAHIHVADRRRDRLEHLQELHARWSGASALSVHEVSEPTAADQLLMRLPPGSLIANATGVGKDVAGSPLTSAAVFPEYGAAWDFNYRGDLGFIAQARGQQAARHLHVEDGWVYFLHGWTRVIADIFDREIPTEGPLFDELGRIAAARR